MMYLIRLPFRMARAALLVPLRDLDDALALSRAQQYMDTYPPFLRSVQ